MLKRNTLAAAITLVLSATGAFASNVTASLTITQSDGTRWAEDMTGLVVMDAQNNFSMLQGTGTTGYFLNGQFVSAQTASQADSWQWTASGDSGSGYWNWHSAQTLSGSTPATTDASNPWQSAIRLQDMGGHGDPDMIYAVSAINNSALAQTYTFTFGEAITPTVSGPNTTYADIAGGLTHRGSNPATGSLTPNNISGVQRFELSSDGGLTFVNAGVDVGPATSFNSTSTYGVYSATNPTGPEGQTWNYMRLVSSFTLSGNSAASFSGYASISPVPEPGVGGMMLLGIGLIGTIVRRRKVWP